VLVVELVSESVEMLVHRSVKTLVVVSVSE
jgi:hypothetical protein